MKKQSVYRLSIEENSLHGQKTLLVEKVIEAENAIFRL